MKTQKGATRASARLFSAVIQRIKELRAEGNSFREIFQFLALTFELRGTTVDM